MPWNGTLLGYRYENGKYIIVPEEAETVRLIFDSYLSGMGITAIMKMLNEKGIFSRNGNAWCKSSVMRVLRNYAYTGNLLLQQTYRENHLTKRTLQNNGELPKYHISAFATMLTEQSEIPIEFNDDLWLAAVDHATVNADETVTFTFKSGIEITEQM